MLKRNSIFIYSILTALGILGAWLVGLFEGETKPEDISGLDLLLSLVGFFILFGAIVGVMIVFSRNRQPMTKEQGISWKQIRVKSKELYIRTLVIRVAIPVIISMSLLTFWNYWTGEPLVKSLEIYGLLTIIIVGGMYFVAIRLWDYYEREYSLLNPETQPNKSMDVRAKQRLCYQRCPLPLRLSLAVSPHVISIVRCLVVKLNVMKILLSFTLLVLSVLTIFAQTEQPKEIFLNSEKMKARIVKQEFPDVPQSVRDCHARGTFRFYVKVDEEGNTKSTKLVSGLCKDANEYLEKTIAAWKFRPLKVDETKAAFRGVVEVPFCYGGFGACDW